MSLYYSLFPPLVWSDAQRLRAAALPPFKSIREREQVHKWHMLVQLARSANILRSVLHESSTVEPGDGEDAEG